MQALLPRDGRAVRRPSTFAHLLEQAPNTRSLCCRTAAPPGAVADGFVDGALVP